MATRQTPTIKVRPGVKVKDLPASPGPIHLYCEFCGKTYSAARGDYFMAAPDTVMRCCDEPMVLTHTVTKEVRLG